MKTYLHNFLQWKLLYFYLLICISPQTSLDSIISLGLGKILLNSLLVLCMGWLKRASYSMSKPKKLVNLFVIIRNCKFLLWICKKRLRSSLIKSKLAQKKRLRSLLLTVLSWLFSIENGLRFHLDLWSLLFISTFLRLFLVFTELLKNVSAHQLRTFRLRGMLMVQIMLFSNVNLGWDIKWLTTYLAWCAVNT